MTDLTKAREALADRLETFASSLWSSRDAVLVLEAVEMLRSPIAALPQSAEEAMETATREERERCSEIAARCAKGIAIEINGETHLLGSMMNDPSTAQYATACAIMEAIEANPITPAERPTAIVEPLYAAPASNAKEADT